MLGARPWLAIVLLLAPSDAWPAAVPVVRIGSHALEVRRAAGAVQVLHLVPGGPPPSDGLAAGVDRWYIASGDNALESVAAALAASPGSAALQGMAAERTTAPERLAVRAIPNPGGGALEARCDLPGAEPARVELLDVQGRRIAKREIAAAGPGTVAVRLDGTRLAPGSYWLRLTQAARAPVTARVVVSR